MDEQQMQLPFPKWDSSSSPSKPPQPRADSPDNQARRSAPQAPADLGQLDREPAGPSAVRQAFRSPEWRVLRSLLRDQRQAMVEVLVSSPNEAQVTEARAGVRMLDWLTDGRWEADIVSSSEPVETHRDYMAVDREEL